MHGPVRAAEFAGTAQITISFAAWTAGKVAATRHEISVRPPKKGPKHRPATERLFKTLPHPDRRANVSDVRLSPDGTRLMAAGYPSGIVQCFDTTTWKEVARIEATLGRRQTTVYAHPMPNWKAVVVDTRTRKVVREEKDGKISERLQIDGSVDSYDPATGKCIDSMPLAGRGPMQLFVLPDSRSVLVNCEGSFPATARERPQSCELLDLVNKTAKPLLDAQAYPAVAPDGKTIFLAKMQFLSTGKVNAALLRYDVASGKVVKSLQPPDEQSYFDGVYLAPNDKWLAVSHRQLNPPAATLVLHAPETLAVVARMPAAKEYVDSAYFDTVLFARDSKTLLARAGGPLLVWNIETNKLVRTIPVHGIEFGRTVLSPDGSRVAICGMPPFDARAAGPDPNADELPQPRLLLIDLADAKSAPEVLMLPPGFVGGMAFSVDGKTLAVGTAGGLHLVDVSARPKK